MSQLKNNGGAAVHIEDVKAMNNGRSGIMVSGTNITIRNADASNNAFAGINGVAGLEIFRASTVQLTDITLEGQVSLNNNGNNELTFAAGLYASFGAVGTVKVTGNLVTNDNKSDGVFLSGRFNTNVSVILGDGSSKGKSGKTSSSGSITSCNNGQTVDEFGDIRNFGEGTFEGNDYTCTNTGGTGDLPECTPCYQNCPKDDVASDFMPAETEEYNEMMDMDTAEERDEMMNMDTETLYLV